MEGGNRTRRFGALTEKEWTEMLFSGDDSQDGEDADSLSNSSERMDDAEMWDIDDEQLDPDFTPYSDSELSIQSEGASGRMSPAPAPSTPANTTAYSRASKPHSHIASTSMDSG